MRTCAFCGSLIETSKPAPSSDIARAIILKIAEEHDVSPLEMSGRSKRAKICKARFCAMSQLRDAGFVYKEIGFFLGGRDHSTIICGLRRWERIKAVESAIKGMLTIYPRLSTQPIPNRVHAYIA